MKINLTSSAENFLVKNNATELIVDITKSCGCNGRVAKSAFVEVVNNFTNSENFPSEMVSNYKIYLNPLLVAVDMSHGITIDTNLSGSSLSAFGLMIK